MKKNLSTKQDAEQTADVKTGVPKKSPSCPVKRKKRRRRIWYALWGLAKLAVFFLFVALTLFAMSGQTYKAPAWMHARIQQQLDSVVLDGKVSFDVVELYFEQGYKPSVTVRKLTLHNASGVLIAKVDAAGASLSPVDLLRGQLRATNVQLDQAVINLRRARNGEFDLGFRLEVDPNAATTTLAQFLDTIDSVFLAPAFGVIETVTLSGLSLNYVDVRAGQDWHLSEGQMLLTQDAQKVDIGVRFGLNYGADTPAIAAFNFETVKGSARAKFGAKVEQVAARDMASQIPALAWLGVLDAPISGALRAEIGEDGLLGNLDGTLEVGKGVLQPIEGARPIAFDSGRAYFGYDPSLQKFRFDELAVITEAGKLVAEGQGYLREVIDGVPEVILGQLRILELEANPEGVFAEPIIFTGGAIDMRLRIDPFAISIGQAVIQDGDYSYLIKGKIAADVDGWHLGMDAHASQIDPKRLMALWPVIAVPGTRNWISENVNTAKLFNVNGALRVDTGQKPTAGLGFEFTGADVRFMRYLPAVKNGTGHASIANNAFTLVVDSGQVQAPEGGKMDATGTVFQIPDINIKGPPAIISLRAKGPVTAAMSLLDQRPFNLMSKARQPVDLATGRASISGEIGLRLLKKVAVDDVEYLVHADLHNIRSDKLVAGKILTSNHLTLTATPQSIEISGAGYLGKVPVQAVWSQKMGPDLNGKSSLQGTIELSQRFSEEFGIGLPKGSITGAGVGNISISFERDKPLKFSLTSDLKRVGLRVADLGWSLAKNRTGKLIVSGTPTKIDELLIEGGGLKASGSVTLTPDGDLKSANFTRVRLSGWLDAPIELVGRGRGATPSVRIKGGMIDTRKTTFGTGSRSGAGAGGTLTVALDRLIVSDGLTLRKFRGTFTRRRGFSGKFTAMLNGQAAISGVVKPTKAGSAFQIKSSDAAAVFRAADIFKTARGGSLDLTLTPRKGADGEYDGQLTGKRIRIKDAPVMANLLSAISGIGLLERLDGKGIVFTRYDAKFRLTPKQLIIAQSSAIGGSLGVSMNGYYNIAAKTLDMQGVISPIYFLNGIGRILTRKGEGLLGFNYKIRGSTDDPKVKVYPLSVLAPSFLRELFKRQPPKLEE